MGAIDRKPAADSNRIHPPIRSIIDALSFRLARLNAVNERLGAGHFRANYDMSLNEWRVLGLTCALQPLSFNRLRSILLMDKGQLSRVVRQLTLRGVIETRPSRTDARAIDLAVTEEGRALHDRMLVFTAERNEAVVGSLTTEECHEFMRLLSKIADHNEALAALSEHLR